MFGIIFGVCGVAFIPAILLFITCGVDTKHKLGEAVVCLIFWLIFSFGLWAQNAVNEENWNGGYCECGTHWELKGADKNRHGTVTKYYCCPDCYEEIEIIE